MIKICIHEAGRLVKLNIYISIKNIRLDTVYSFSWLQLLEAMRARRFEGRPGLLNPALGLSVRPPTCMNSSSQSYDSEPLAAPASGACGILALMPKKRSVLERSRYERHRRSRNPEDCNVPRPVQRLTVVAATQDALREKILGGEVREGERLLQDALAEEYGVSRIPVREALRQLEAEGLVTFYPHRGAVVSSFSLEEISELFELRALLEPDVLRRAVPRLRPEDFRRAQQILDEYDVALRRREPAKYGPLNREFHFTLYAPARRLQSMEVLDNLYQRLDLYVRMQLTLTHGEGRAEREHRRILQLCESQDREAACDLMAEHILHAGHSLIEFLKVHRGKTAQESGDQSAGSFASNSLASP